MMEANDGTVIKNKLNYLKFSNKRTPYRSKNLWFYFYSILRLKALAKRTKKLDITETSFSEILE